MQLLKKCFYALKSQLRYFSDGKTEIARENLITMMVMGALGSIVTIIFFIIAPIIIPTWKITKEYICIVPVLVASFLFSFFCLHRKKEPNPLTVEIASSMLYVLLIAVFIAISVFPYPGTPQIFISLCFMFMPALLIIRPSLLIPIIVISEIVFLWLASQLKTAFALENDIFNTVASIFFALIIMLMTNRLRFRNYDTRMKLQKLGQTDQLTGLLNKKAFEECCSLFLATNNPLLKCSLLVIDLDDFKLVNDIHGHLFGDALLEAVGSIISGCFRKTDIAGRVGGDEFAVILCDIGDHTFLEKKCADLRDRFAGIKIADEPFRVGCSIGVTIADGCPNYAELFKNSDMALYEVKHKKKNPSGDEIPIDWLIVPFGNDTEL